MASLNSGEQMRLLRLTLAASSIIISQIEGAMVGAEGETTEDDIPALVWQLRNKIGQAGALAAEWDQALNEGTAEDPDQEQEPQVEI